MNNQIYEVIDTCRICGSRELSDVLDLTSQPPANSLYKPSEETPPNAPLQLNFCDSCSAVQLSATVDPDYLFNRYVWVTGTSKTAVEYSHFFAKEVIARCKKSTPSVLEVASNDGTFLERFKELGCEILGVDPAQNIAAEATSKGIPTVADFFTEEVAEKLTIEHGKYDVVFARNVLPHVKAVHSVVAGIAVALQNDGLGVIEFHDAGLILEELHYDSIYHEHLFLLSLKTIEHLLSGHGLKIFDLNKSPISGGSWVIYVSHESQKKSQELIKAELNETKIGVNTLDGWKKFALNAKSHAEALKKIVCDSEEKLLAYGASARSSTLLNFCGLSNEHIRAIIDKNPLKVGLLTPGSNIPIISYEEGLKQLLSHDKILLLAWNFKDEVIADLREAGFKGQFIVPLPNKVHII